MEKSKELGIRGNFIIILSFWDSRLTGPHHDPAVPAGVPVLRSSGTCRDVGCEEPMVLAGPGAVGRVFAACVLCT